MTPSKVFITKALPDDGISRVIYSLGPLVKNPLATTPRIDVFTKRLLEDGALSDGKERHTFGVTELTSVKIGDVFAGNRKMPDERWEGWRDHTGFPVKETFRERRFTFDLGECRMDTVVLDVRRGRMATPQEAISAGSDHLRSTLTRIVDGEGSVYLIPAIELFVSTYAPRRADLTIDLLGMPLDKALEKYVIKHKCLEREYRIWTRVEHLDETSALLGHLCCNEISRGRAARIWNSIQRNMRVRDGRHISHPEILPFAPDTLDIVASGIVIPHGVCHEKSITYIQRIERYIPKFRVRTKLYVIRNVGEEEDSLPEPLPSPTFNMYEIPADLPVDSERDPGPHAGRKLIRSGISIDSSGSNVVRRTEKRSAEEEGRSRYESVEAPADALSAGHTSGADESRTVGRAVFVGNEALPEEEPPPPSGHFLEVVETLLEIRDSGAIASLRFVDNRGVRYPEPAFCTFGRSLIVIDGKRSFWVSLTRKSDTDKTFRPRRMVVAEIVTKPGRDPVYLLEVERKNASEQFLGLLFTLPEEPDAATMAVMLETVARHKARFSSKFWNDGEFPGTIVRKFQHRGELEKVYGKILSACHEISKNDLRNNTKF